MKTKTKLIRKAIKHIPGAWVRVIDDHTALAGKLGSAGFTIDDKGEVKAALESAGFNCRMEGKPGTSGQHVITIDM